MDSRVPKAASHTCHEAFNCHSTSLVETLERKAIYQPGSSRKDLDYCVLLFIVKDPQFFGILKSKVSVRL